MGFAVAGARFAGGGVGGVLTGGMFVLFCLDGSGSAPGKPYEGNC